MLGEQLRRVRLAAGYKIQDSFAVAMHVSQDTISKAETTNDSALVREAIMIFEMIRGRALNVEESRAVLMEARAQWESQQR